jgi:methyl-accepting chemotaxis protein
MSDSKKAENKAAESVSAKKVATTKKPAKKTSSASTKKEPDVAAVVIKGSAAIAKAAALKEADLQAAARKISEVDKRKADDAIKSKKSVEDLKSRAHEAKLRAQKKILEEAYVSDKPVDPLERLANTFDSSAKRWEMVVYPSLFAFVLLAGYGFFLIYRLTHDISTLSQSVTRMAVIVSDAMPRMTKDLSTMTGSIDNMTGNIDGMSTEISSMSGQMGALTPMSKNIKSMTNNIGSMNRSVYGMQRDMHGMNRTVSSGPFGMMNDMMPFSSSSNVPPQMAPPPVWPAYNQVPQRGYVMPAAIQTRQAHTPAPAKPVPVKQAPIKSVTVKPVLQKKMAKKVTVPGASPVSLKGLSRN